ncbi:Ubiquinone biosynthesis protein COQ9 [Commensalibacter communis]|uniref:Ubiquinone biosynthesis protein COQ9 n=1 Tax=Commensalibacter communis TaxID=2972786 RepID=A0A9W4TSD5_9PROT|nr:TetR family transcriptional regulator [Commensalibacter communis]CAI3950804.1 Ubiquinone biosynthesis protein COQ9 [Commensalibacter communis]CAI3952283.1 Ubiquinone biosynthesis protein COQ9 [Commensalibacter communis]CAI3954871.1 Ubiquinone biosynthesis protein COQ9 [Commensalibacter communis]CAI3954876.1 Ubiquinone biosynthesis protein COQ9 [Commensalibacter communis]
MMNNEELNLKLLNSAMNIAAEQGWNQMSIVEAARQADIPTHTARQRFPCKSSLLLYLNRLADESALEQAYHGQVVADYLFDLFMSRFDFFQDYRKGFISALHNLPFNPALAVIMGVATQNSMKWIAESAQIKTNGIRGLACIKGLTGIWALNMRVWIKDDTADLSQTMASLDQTIKKAGKFSPYFVVKNDHLAPENQPEHQDEPFISEKNE